MSYAYNNPSMASGSGGVRGTNEFGKIYVVEPKGEHQATIVWLHGLGDNGSSWSQQLERLHLPNIKWICPTAPLRHVTSLGGYHCSAWFDMGELSEESRYDLQGLEASAAHIANLLSAEPSDVKLGIGGFNMGAATALYSATCFALGEFQNGNQYPIHLSAIIDFSGYLPYLRQVRNMIEETDGAEDRTSELPILMCHGKMDDVVPFSLGVQSWSVLRMAGFHYLSSRGYEGLGHSIIPEEMDYMSDWLTRRLELGGASA